MGKEQAAKNLLLYHTPLGAPCRAVLLGARLLGIDLALHKVDMHVKREHMSEWYGKINPQRVTPTLVDDDYVLWESRAINKYLVMKHGRGKLARVLWPKDPQHQALVDRLLYFDMGNLYQSMTDYFKPMLIFGKAPAKYKLAEMEKNLCLLNNILKKSEFAAGPCLSLADISLVTSVTQLSAYGYNIDPEKYSKVDHWVRRVRCELPFFDEVCSEGLEKSAMWAASKMKHIKK